MRVRLTSSPPVGTLKPHSSAAVENTPPDNFDAVIVEPLSLCTRLGGSTTPPRPKSGIRDAWHSSIRRVPRYAEREWRMMSRPSLCRWNAADLPQKSSTGSLRVRTGEKNWSLSNDADKILFIDGPTARDSFEGAKERRSTKADRQIDDKFKRRACQVRRRLGMNISPKRK